MIKLDNLFRSISTDLRRTVSNKIYTYNIALSSNTRVQIFRTACLNLDG